MRQDRGFTLLEVALAVLISMLIILAATPSIQALITEQRFKKSYDSFEALVGDAQTRSLVERRPFAIVWEEERIVVRPAEPDEEDDGSEESSIANPDGAAYALELPAALVEEPAARWTFWPTGACEPAIIHYRSSGGSWTAAYDPLTARPTITGGADET